MLDIILYYIYMWIETKSQWQNLPPFQVAEAPIEVKFVGPITRPVSPYDGHMMDIPHRSIYDSWAYNLWGSIETHFHRCVDVFLLMNIIEHPQISAKFW